MLVNMMIVGVFDEYFDCSEINIRVILEALFQPLPFRACFLHGYVANLS
jgi:hypothetical protein